LLSSCYRLIDIWLDKSKYILYVQDGEAKIKRVLLIGDQATLFRLRCYTRSKAMFRKITERLMKRLEVNMAEETLV